MGPQMGGRRMRRRICGRRDLQKAIKELLREYGELSVEELHRLLLHNYEFGRNYDVTRQAVTIYTRRVAATTGITMNKYGKPVRVYTLEA